MLLVDLLVGPVTRNLHVNQDVNTNAAGLVNRPRKPIPAGSMPEHLASQPPRRFFSRGARVPLCVVGLHTFKETVNYIIRRRE